MIISIGVHGKLLTVVAQLTANGADLRYSTYLGGNGGDVGLSIAVDRWGQAYVTGSTSSTDFPTVKPVQPAFGGNSEYGRGDAFIAKLTADGRALSYSTFLGVAVVVRTVPVSPWIGGGKPL